MSAALTAALSLVVDIIRDLIDFMFSTEYPGFTVVSIGAVAVAIMMISYGFDYLDFFLGGGSSIREDKK